MKKVIFFSLLMLLPLPLWAAQDVANNLSYKELEAYNRDFDILLADIVVSDNNGVADVLQAITVNNTRDANNADIDKLVLWADNGDDVWQGYMIDNQLAEGDRVDYKRWVFTDLDYAIPVGGLHLYVSMETSNAVTLSRKVQLEIERLSDANEDGDYQANDRGIFVASDNDGPIDQSIVSGYVYTLKNRTIDILAPKVAITNLVNGGNYTLSDAFIIEGVAKDRMQGSPKFLQVSIVPSGSPIVWQDAESLSTNFASWSFAAKDLAAGSYELRTNVSDWDYNIEVSEVMTITLSEQAIEPEPETPVEEPAQTADRLIKTESSPKVYLLKDNVPYWFYNAFVFSQYYDDFSGLEFVSEEEMASYGEEQYMPMKVGTLVKEDFSPKVYEVGADWKIRWIPNEAEALSLYGEKWSEKVNTIPSEYLIRYNKVDSL